MPVTHAPQPVASQSNHATQNIHSIHTHAAALGDPASERFGGNVFHSEATDAGMNDNHGTYWDKENIKARNLMGDVTTGNLETD